jgi:hypothetical protein
VKRLLPLCFLLIAACATAPAPAPAPTPAPQKVTTIPGAGEFAALEAHLLGLENLNVRFYIEAKGSMQMLAKGELVRYGDLLTFIVTGKLNGTTEHGDLRLEKTPEATRRTILLGLTRMGLAHNIYRLYNDQEVDADIDQRVKTANETWDPAARKLAFDILFNGEKAAEAELWLNDANLPVKRHQVVHFPNGDMIVDETYQWRY